MNEVYLPSFAVTAVTAVTAQVITSAEFHPSQCNVLAYSSSKGCIRLADMRSAALCDRHAKALEEVESQVNGEAGSSFHLTSTNAKSVKSGGDELDRPVHTSS